MELNEETWKDIIGFEGLYQVSNCGNVKSLNYKRTGEEQQLRPIKAGKGYLTVDLRKEGKYHRFYVHRLVAETFIQNPDNLPEINHKDENKVNNNVENLEWCKHKYNCMYGTRNKRLSDIMKDKDSKRVYQYSLYGELVAIWPKAIECQTNNFDASCIAKCCRGERKTHKGYKWSYTPIP